VSLLRFEIRYGDGRKEILHVDGERALIGNADQAAYEHVAVEVLGGTVRLETKAFEPPATVNGMPFTNIPIGADVPLKIGSTSIFVALGEAPADGSTVVQQKKEKTNPILKLLAVIVFPLGGYMLMMDDEVEVSPSPSQVPEIFAAPIQTCPQASPDQAAAFANDKFDMAEGKRERSPFVPKDGVQAVQLYETASACFKVARNPARAADADLAAKQLRTSITLDFRARRVRLEHLMAVADYDLARRDVTVLRALTEGQTGKYVTWLAEINQTLKQKVAKP
jgi:hypothetical protein